MSLIALRSQINQLQTEIADWQARKRLLMDERFAQQDLHAFQKRAGTLTEGYHAWMDRQAAHLEEDLNDIESNLMRKQDELQRAQIAWIEYLSRLPEKIVVLFFAANPLGQERLRLDEEARAIAERIKMARHRDAVKLETCWAVRPLDVIEGINEHRPRIVHFSGHGTTDQIIFQNGAGQVQPVSKEAIVQAMQAAGGDLQLVFFNTCFSKDQAQAVVQHVSAAIGMKTAIRDDAAIVFAAQFYSTIGYGHSVQRAFDQARAALMMEGIPQQDTPELFVAEGLSADDIILVRPPEIAEK